jgi:hypothetical protein
MTTVTEIAHLRDRIIELLEELDKERNLIAAMREHIEKAHEQVERSNQTIEQWIERFEMTPTDKGWAWADDPIEGYNDLLNKYNDLVKKWNRYIGSLKTRRAIGRPRKLAKCSRRGCAEGLAEPGPARAGAREASCADFGVAVWDFNPKPE